ncbi:MAG: hypothetical protein V1809_10210 [Planctomycetota bacterium]
MTTAPVSQGLVSYDQIHPAHKLLIAASNHYVIAVIALGILVFLFAVAAILFLRRRMILNLVLPLAILPGLLGWIGNWRLENTIKNSDSPSYFNQSRVVAFNRQYMTRPLRWGYRVSIPLVLIGLASMFLASRMIGEPSRPQAAPPRRR